MGIFNWGKNRIKIYYADDAISSCSIIDTEKGEMYFYLRNGEIKAERINVKSDIKLRNPQNNEPYREILSTVVGDTEDMTLKLYPQRNMYYWYDDMGNRTLYGNFEYVK